MPAGAYYIENIEWRTLETGEPCIFCIIDGQRCQVPMMQKTILLNEDIVALIGPIDQPELETEAGDIIPAGAGPIRSPSLVLEVQALTDAYEAGTLTSDPRYKGAA